MTSSAPYLSLSYCQQSELHHTAAEFKTCFFLFWMCSLIWVLRAEYVDVRSCLQDGHCVVGDAVVLTRREPCEVGGRRTLRVTRRGFVAGTEFTGDVLRNNNTQFDVNLNRCLDAFQGSSDDSTEWNSVSCCYHVDIHPNKGMLSYIFLLAGLPQKKFAVCCQPSQRVWTQIKPKVMIWIRTV